MNKPIVEVFKTINSHYIYDGVKCEILEIDRSSYDYLFNVLIKGEEFDAYDTAYNSRYDSRYISGRYAEDLAYR